MAHYFLLSFDQLLLIALTCIIAYSVVKQVKYVKEQARLFAESDARQRERQRERDQPKVRFSNATSTFVEDTADGNRERKTFVGLIYANASPFDITIMFAEFEVGVPTNTPFEGQNVPIRSLHFTPVGDYKGTKLSDGLPRRLRHGETITMLYDEEELLEKLRKHGGGEPAAVLPVCLDSLGNKHRADSWTVWGKNSLGGRHDPGPGYITWDEWWAKRQKVREAQRGKAKRNWGSRTMHWLMSFGSSAVKEHHNRD